MERKYESQSHPYPKVPGVTIMRFDEPLTQCDFYFYKIHKSVTNPHFEESATNSNQAIINDITTFQAQAHVIKPISGISLMQAC